MEFAGGLFKAILERYTDSIIDHIACIPKDTWEKFKVDFDISFRKYIQGSYNKYSKIKTILFRTEPKYIYDFFEPPTLRKDNDSCIDTVTVENILDISHFIIIQGTGGIGKSMLLKHFFIDELSKKDLIPIFLELKDINDVNNEYDIESIVLEKLSNLGSQIVDKYLRYALESGCFLFLLDGYDEILTEKKDLFFKKLDSFIDKYSNNYFILTSRPYSNFVEFQRFTVLTALALNKQQAISLIKRLDYDNDIKENFITALDKKLYAQHKSFASNPLLLNIMLMTFESYAEIPEKLHLFYANAFETLYSKHDATKAGYKREMLCKLPYDSFKKIFSYFSFMTYNQGKIAFSQGELETIIERISELCKIDFSIRNYIYDLVNSLCVLYKEGLEYEYAHRSFQEYFTAVFLRELPDSLMTKIGLKMLEKDLYRTATDAVFTMLYDMTEDRFEQNILLPVLEKYEENCSIDSKYDFYFEKEIDRIKFDNYREKIGLWKSLTIRMDMASFIDESTRHYMIRNVKPSEEKQRSQEDALKELLDYLTQNKDYCLGEEIPTKELIEDPIIYRLLKKTWIGEKIMIMSNLSVELKRNRDSMQTDLTDLLCT